MTQGVPALTRSVATLRWRSSPPGCGNSEDTLAGLALAVEKNAAINHPSVAHGLEIAGAMLHAASLALGPPEDEITPTQAAAATEHLDQVDQFFSSLRAIIVNGRSLSVVRRNCGRAAPPDSIPALRRLTAPLSKPYAPSLYRLGHPPATGPPPPAQRALSTSTLTAARPPAPAATFLAGAAT